MMEKQQDVFSSVMKLMRTMRRKERPAKNESRGSVRLLSILEKENGLQSRGLAERMEIRASSLTEMLNRLEKDGIIERLPDENDQRKVRVCIKAEGYAILEKAKERRRKERAYINKTLTEEEQATFIAICEKLTASMDEKRDSEGES